MNPAGIRTIGNGSKADSFLDNAKGRKCEFVCVISYTKTCEVPGITVAGANPDLIKYTAAADVEFLYHGECRCIHTVPATPDGKPTPAVITRAALRSADIPLTVCDAGSKIKPDVPFVALHSHPGENIANGHALNDDSVRKILAEAIRLGMEIGDETKHIVIGESMPAGTTTALGVLMAMGVDAKFKVSSSMPENPHQLKLSVVERGMKAAGISPGSLADSPIDAISYMGDPMIPAVAGIVIGASKNSSVMLAGGTQMAAVLRVMSSLDEAALDKIVIGTTRYIIDDKSADMADLIRNIADVPILCVDPHLENSSKEGLRAYSNGFVKEGVGAGGACIAAMLKRETLGERELLSEIEREYERAIESRL